MLITAMAKKWTERDIRQAVFSLCKYGRVLEDVTAHNKHQYRLAPEGLVNLAKTVAKEDKEE